MGEDDDGLAVDAHLLDLALEVEVDEVSVGAEACVIDQQVDVGPELGDLAYERAGLGGEVTGDDLGGPGELAGELLEALATPRDPAQGVAAVGELARELLSDPPRMLR